jgi:hypothetical protein
MADVVFYYYSYYIRASIHFWRNLEPYQYGAILTVIGIIGYFLMRGNSRK